MLSTEVSSLTNSQIQTLLNHIKYDELKDHMKKEVTKSKMDLVIIKASFLKEVSESSKKIYEPILNSFLNSVSHPLDFTVEEADNFIYSLSESYSNASVRLHVSVISSFYNKIERWGYIAKNPFFKCKLPKQQRKKELKVPESEEVGILISHLEDILQYEGTAYHSLRRKESARKMLASIHIMLHTGVRVGAIKDLVIVGDKYSVMSKGKKVRGNFSPELKGILENLGFVLNEDKPFHILNKAMIQFNLVNISKDLKLSGKIRKEIHPHSFRHYFAIKHYNETKDIYEVSRLLNHSSVSITQKYLDSMEA